MYGLLLEAIGVVIRQHYGEEAWREIQRRAGVGHESFCTHTTYPEHFIPRISQEAAAVLGTSSEEVMDEFGMGFVVFMGQYGYDNILRVLGRHMRDFLNGLDNLHEYMRFSYKHMQAPSFFVENETRTGLTLHYRTRRRGYEHYVMGQIRQVGRDFYAQDVDIRMVSKRENPSNHTLCITYDLYFDNSAFREQYVVVEDSPVVDNTPLRAVVLLDLFPFHVVFDPDMVIHSVGSALDAVIPKSLGQLLTEIFNQTRPLTTFCWEEIMHHTNNVFELVTRDELKKPAEYDKVKQKVRKQSEASSDTCDTGQQMKRRVFIVCASCSTADEDEGSNRLHLKGQMVFMSEWNSIMFIGTPVMQTLDDMFRAGLYINDLSMHDCSRDLVLAGTQQSAELKLALAQEQQKSQLLTASMKKLDEEIRTTDEFVYQMIPKPVADRLRQGESAVNTCQSFDCVTILFSDVVGFTTICSRITPMEVVSMLNAMYTSFDRLSEKHSVYKVETIGDAYMAVAGAPTVTEDHAESMCDMALDMLYAMPHLKDPSSNDSMKIRIGIHTGSTVAGVVGLKMPRYCLFGDTVNTASRMESNGEAMKIHLSETTREKLVNTPYLVQERGVVHIKGKGSMKTYWMEGRQGKSVQERKGRETQKQSTDADTQSVDGDSHLLVNALPTHRHMYSPVSFDDLTEPGFRHSPDGTPEHSLSNAREEGAPERKVSNGSAERRVSVAGSGRRVSGPWAQAGIRVSDVHGDRGISRPGPGKEVSWLCPAVQEHPQPTGSVGSSLPPSRRSPDIVVTAPTVSDTPETVQVTGSAGQQPTLSCSHSPSRQDAAGQPQGRRTLHGHSPCSHQSNSADLRNPPPSRPCRCNDKSNTNDNSNNNNSTNNSDKNGPVPLIPTSEGGPSTIRASRDVANDKPSGSGHECGHKTAEQRNGKAKGLKQRAERSLSVLQRQKSPRTEKSRSKTCVVL